MVCFFAPIGATDAECGRARMTQARVKARNLSQAISYQPRTLLGRSFQEPTLQARYCMQISFNTRTFARLGLKALPFVATLLAATSPSFAANEPNQAARTEACAGDNGGITLPRGFCATVFADNIGHARHMAVGSNGVVYVNTWSGPLLRQ